MKLIDVLKRLRRPSGVFSCSPRRRVRNDNTGGSSHKARRLSITAATHSLLSWQAQYLPKRSNRWNASEARILGHFFRGVGGRLDEMPMKDLAWPPRGKTLNSARPQRNA
jgi:hypothetical protein